jgi:hypothetical protein
LASATKTVTTACAPVEAKQPVNAKSAITLLDLLMVTLLSFGVGGSQSRHTVGYLKLSYQ